MKKILTIPLLCLLSTVVYANECTPTPHRTTGTHYEPVTEQKQDIGKGLKISGRILVAPDCTPLANTRVSHWQAGENGRYQDRLRAYLMTDEKGRFSFETEWPNMFSPHIHFIVTKKGFKTLETQWIGEERVDEFVFDMIVLREK